MNRVQSLSILILLCVITGLVGCAPTAVAQPTNTPAPAATAAPVNTEPPAAATTTPQKITKTVTDMTGRKVEVPLEVNRIVVIHGACGIPGMLTALGVGDKLVSGICFQLGPEDIQYKIQPDYADLDVIKPGDAGVDAEQLLVLKPDLVIAWTNLTNADKLAEAGIPVLIEDVSTWDNVRSVFTMLGEALNNQERAAQFVTAMDQMAERIKEIVSSIPDDKRVKVVVLSKTKPITILGGESHNNFMIKMTGGIPAMQDVPGHFITIDLEQILKKDPDIIIVSATCPQCVDEIYQSSEWQALRAVKDKKVYLAPKGILFWDKPDVETSLGLLWETYVQYPDLVTEEDVIKETKQYFHEFFNYDLTDADIKLIFHK